MDGIRLEKFIENWNDNQLDVDEMHTHFFFQFLYKQVVAISISFAPPQWPCYDDIEGADSDG